MTRGTVTAFRKMELSHEILIPLFLTMKRAEGAANGTISIYEYHIKQFFREYPDAFSGTERLKECVYGFLGGETLHPVVYNMRRRFVGAFIEWMRGEGYVPENPCSRFKFRKEPGRIVEVKPEVLQHLLAAPRKDTFAGIRDYAMFVVMLDCGIRPQEIRKLMPGDIDLEKGFVSIRPEIAKTKEARTLPISTPSIAAVRKLLSVRLAEWKGATLFCMETGAAMSSNALVGIMRKYRNRIGETNLPVYALRHSFCTAMMKNGANMDTIRQMMGHTDFKILRTYMHLTSDDVKSEHETHSPLLTLLPQSTKKLRAI